MPESHEGRENNERQDKVLRLGELIAQYDTPVDGAGNARYTLRNNDLIFLRSPKEGIVDLILFKDKGKNDLVDIAVYRVANSSAWIRKVRNVAKSESSLDYIDRVIAEKAFEPMSDDDLDNVLEFFDHFESKVLVTEPTIRKLEEVITKRCSSTRAISITKGLPEFNEELFEMVSCNAEMSHACDRLVTVQHAVLQQRNNGENFDIFTIKVDEMIDGSHEQKVYTINTDSGEISKNFVTVLGVVGERKPDKHQYFTEQDGKWLMHEIFGKRPFPPKYEDFIPLKGERAPTKETFKKFIDIIVSATGKQALNKGALRREIPISTEGGQDADLILTYYPKASKSHKERVEIAKVEFIVPENQTEESYSLFSAFSDGSVDQFFFTIPHEQFATEADAKIMKNNMQSFIENARESRIHIMNEAFLSSTVEGLIALLSEYGA